MVEKPMLWHVVANFFDETGGPWLDDFIEDPALTFRKIPAPVIHNWHRLGNQTSASQWRNHMSQAWAGARGRPDGILTCFPQLAFCVALLRAAGRTNARIVAHNFNLGSIEGRARGKMAGAVLSHVDRFLVHSPSEVGPYSEWLGLPPEKFVFVPLQSSGPSQAVERSADSYIAAVGSAHRDYETLIAAVRPLGIPTKIVCKASIAEKLNAPDFVEIRSNLSQEECWTLIAGARLSVTPISNLETASGQVTIIDSMRLGTPVLVTRCPGTEWYVEHLKTGITVDPFDAGDMSRWISKAWSDDELLDTLRENARVFYEANLSDRAAASRLRDVLLTLTSR